jgi:hypothetical protein
MESSGTINKNNLSGYKTGFKRRLLKGGFLALNTNNVREKLIWVAIAVFITALVSGCGGGGGITPTKSVEQPSIAPSGERSVRISNYNNWNPVCDTEQDNAQKIQILALHSSVVMTEGWSAWWVKPPVSPAAIKAINPSTKVYRAYTLLAKPNWDTDWNEPSNVSTMLFPITKAEIDANDWWLRDANGNIVNENTRVWFVDVGKPGFKELFLQRILERNAGKGFDGILFDYWWPRITRVSELTGCTLPIKGYSSDTDWQEKAWKPFITYVMDGLHAAGYKIVGNCAGDWSDEWDPIVKFQRSKLDGVVYEQWMIDWPQNGSGWLSGDRVEKRINSFQNDPLDVWIGEYGLQLGIEDYDRKRLVSLAGYYIAVPQDDSKRSYHYYRNANIFWDTLWDFSIGKPAETAVKMTGKYFWSRKFTQGIVLLNYEESESISFTLDKTYRDQNSKVYTGKVTLPPHTALILAAVQ